MSHTQGHAALWACCISPCASITGQRASGLCSYCGAFPHQSHTVPATFNILGCQASEERPLSSQGTWLEMWVQGGDTTPLAIPQASPGAERL